MVEHALELLWYTTSRNGIGGLDTFVPGTGHGTKLQ
jgi:hypothetical protein